VRRSEGAKVRVTAVCVVLSVAALSARQQSAPASASIRGSVYDAQGAEVPGVIAVVLPSDPTKWAGAAGTPALQRVPIAAGRFTISGVPPGDYRLAFAMERGLDGWPQPASLDRFAKAMPVQLAAGEQISIDAVVRLSGTDVILVNAMMARSAIEVRPAGLPAGVSSPGRGQPPRPPSTAPGAISGRVTDADGQPVAGLVVQAMRRVGTGPASQLANFGTTAITDADGRYRLANRSAGSFLVCVPAYTLDRTSLAGGSVRRVPAPTIGPDGVKRAYQTTFHPQATVEDAAVPVIVGTTEIGDIDIQLVRAPVFDIRGSVSGARFVGPQAALTASPVRPADRMSMVDTRWVPLSDDGTFVVEDLRDDEYQLSLSTGAGWSRARVIVAGRAPAPVVMTMQPDVVVSGRAEFRGATLPPAGPPSPLSGIELAPAVLTPGASFSRMPIRPDGAFTARGSGPGPFILRGVIPAPWIQISGLINGVDTMDVPWVPGTRAENALVIFADRASSLMVRVRDGKDQPVAGAGVIVFAEDPVYWSARSRRVQLAETSAAGICTLTDFPPGRYHVIASRDFGSTSPVTRAFVERLPRGVVFEISAGEIRSILVRGN